MRRCPSGTATTCMSSTVTASQPTARHLDGERSGLLRPVRAERAAFREEHHRQPSLLGDRVHPARLAVVLVALVVENFPMTATGKIRKAELRSASRTRSAP